MTTDNRMPTPMPRVSQSQTWLGRNLQGLRDFGFEHFLRVLSHLLPYWLFNYNHAIMYVADNLSPDVPPNPECKIRFAVEADAEAAIAVKMDRELFLKRIRRGDTCGVVTQRERIVCMMWASTHRIFSPLTGSILDPGSNGVYFYHLYTLPEERGKGLTRLCYRIQADHYRSLGRTIVYTGVETYNTASHSLVKKFGFWREGETIKFVFLGITVCWYRSWPHPKRRFHIFFRMPTDIEWA